MMKNKQARICVIVLLICFSCSKSTKESPLTTAPVKDSLAKVKIAKEDSSKLVRVIYISGTGSNYEREAYNAFGKWFKALNSNCVYAPDTAQEIFIKDKFYKNKSNPIRKIQSGPDFFYLYAHFLQKKNGIGSNVELRGKILRIFTLINTIHSNIDFDGGIYFSNQRTASAAYAEFALYNYIRYNAIFKKEYSIQNQKSLYIQLLKQKVDDELNEMIKTQSGQYWYLDTPERRKEWRKETFVLIEELESLIETYLDLKIAQEFQYSHYA